MTAGETFGLQFVYLVANMLAIFLLYWLARVGCPRSFPELILSGSFHYLQSGVQRSSRGGDAGLETVHTVVETGISSGTTTVELAGQYKTSIRFIHCIPILHRLGV